MIQFVPQAKHAGIDIAARFNFNWHTNMSHSVDLILNVSVKKSKLNLTAISR